MFLLVLATLAVGGVLALIYLARALATWRRSYSLFWPERLAQRDQARICRRFFARAGIAAEGPLLYGYGYDLVLRVPQNIVLVAFRSSQFPFTESFLRDLKTISATNTNISASSANIIEVVVLHPNAATRSALHAGRESGTPILLPSQLPALRDLLKSPTRDLRKSLLVLTTPAAT